MSERDASTYRRGAFTPSQMKLADFLNKARIFFTIEEPLQHDGKTYHIDIAVQVHGPTKLAVEIFGEGTNSDQEARDFVLRQHGYLPMYIPNKMIELFPGHVVKDIRNYIRAVRA